jgi:hypothetical protein
VDVSSPEGVRLAGLVRVERVGNWGAVLVGVNWGALKVGDVVGSGGGGEEGGLGSTGGGGKGG